MSKKMIYTLVGILIGLLVVGGGAYWYITSQNKEQNTAEKTSTTSSETKSRKASFLAVTGEGEAQYCSMKYSGPKGSGEGKMYTDGEGNGRMEMTMETTKGNTGTSNQIIKDDKVYSWFETNGKTMGMIMPVQEGDEQAETTTSSSEDSSPGPDEDFTLNCEDWTVDTAKFDVPTTVNFMDMQNMPSVGQ